MSDDREKERAALERRALDRAQQALRLVSASLPHLSGLVHHVRLKATPRVNVAAVSASGLVLVNPKIFARSPLGESSYVLAHELMHLALDSHSRQGDARPLVVNYAHDFIINDILSEELERDPPLNGLQMDGARERSLEELVVELQSGGEATGPGACWSPEGALRPGAEAPSPLSRALLDAGLVETPPEEESVDPRLSQGDLIPDALEAELEPHLSSAHRERVKQDIRNTAAKALSLAELNKKLQEADDTVTVQESEVEDAMVSALRGAYHTPWQLALQRWMDAVAPGDRTYSRPSRRGAARTDVVLPGRRREGWTLHLVLDTSGSMSDALPTALGAIASFCDASGVAEVHVVQCDAAVTRDEWVEPSELGEYRVSGFGWSDMTPAMDRLAEDPEVTAVVVLTDGGIDYPREPPPYFTLWVLLGNFLEEFDPPYGEVLQLR